MPDIRSLLQEAALREPVMIPAYEVVVARRRTARRNRWLATTGVTLSCLLAVGAALLTSARVDGGTRPALRQGAGPAVSPSPNLSPYIVRPGGPPSGPCVFPNSTELAELRGQSSVVIEGIVAEVVPNSGNDSSYFPRREVSVTKNLAGPAVTSLQVADTGGPVPLLPAGRFVLFLKETTIPGRYYVVNGLLGAFAIHDGGVDRFCANYNDPANPRPALGNGVAVDSFEAQVQSTVGAAIPAKKN